MIVDSVVGIAGKVLDKFVGDKDLKTKLEAELQKELIGLDMANAQANIESAKSSHLFVSGARPAIMWICALGLLTNFFLMPIAEWITTIWLPDVILPELKTDELMTLTLSLLGLGGMRSWEKSKGVARENLK
jgi:hypothetical protein|tara:strand:- start:1951 stop:2346 length:396 start_codon:yes stop_codon:yes gene_type:complete